jgi:hypothetical protein
MTHQRQPPSEATLQAFGEHLDQFRGTLPDEQRPLLDTMLAAGLRPEGQDVQTYWAQYNGVNTSANPAWYQGSGAAAWNNSAWGTAWLNY